MRRLAAALLALALLLGAGSALGGDAGDEQAQRSYWIERAREVRARHREALERYEAALDAYERANRRRNLRGARKAALIEARDAARAELERAQRELLAFPERARREGALPGWIREAEAAEPAAPPESGEPPAAPR